MVKSNPPGTAKSEKIEVLTFPPPDCSLVDEIIGLQQSQLLTEASYIRAANQWK